MMEYAYYGAQHGVKSGWRRYFMDDADELCRGNSLSCLGNGSVIAEEQERKRRTEQDLASKRRRPEQMDNRQSIDNYASTTESDEGDLIVKRTRWDVEVCQIQRDTSRHMEQHPNTLKNTEINHQTRGVHFMPSVVNYQPKPIKQEKAMPCHCAASLDLAEFNTMSTSVDHETWVRSLSAENTPECHDHFPITNELNWSVDKPSTFCVADMKKSTLLGNIFEHEGLPRVVAVYSLAKKFSPQISDGNGHGLSASSHIEVFPTSPVHRQLIKRPDDSPHNTSRGSKNSYRAYVRSLSRARSEAIRDQGKSINNCVHPLNDCYHGMASEGVVLDDDGMENNRRSGSNRQKSDKHRAATNAASYPALHGIMAAATGREILPLSIHPACQMEYAVCPPAIAPVRTLTHLSPYATSTTTEATDTWSHIKLRGVQGTASTARPSRAVSVGGRGCWKSHRGVSLPVIPLSQRYGITGQHCLAEGRVGPTGLTTSSRLVQRPIPESARNFPDTIAARDTMPMNDSPYLRHAPMFSGVLPGLHHGQQSSAGRTFCR